MSFREIVIECGASRLAFAAFSRRRDRIRLENHDSIDLAGMAETSWLHAVSNALMTLGGRVMRKGPVTIVLPPHLVLMKFIRVPRIESAKLAKVIAFEAEQNIPFALADVVWDSVTTAEYDHEQELLLAAAKLEAVEPLCAAVQAAGFVPRLILPLPLATLAAFRLVYATPKEPALVLNLGARSTTLLQVEGARFVARTFALASQTADTRETFATRLAQEIIRSGLFFKRQSGMENPVRIYLTGGRARLAGLSEALAAKLKVPVDRLDVLGAIEVGPDAVRSNATEQALMLTDLAGAAVIQLRPGLPSLNLLPSRLRSQESLRRRQPWLATAAFLATLVLLPPLFHFRAVAAAARHKTDAIERALAPLRERDARNRANLQKLAELKQQVAQLQGIHDRRIGWLMLLADLQDRLVKVEDVWLERMSVLSAPGAPLKLAVSGRMLDQTNPLSQVSPETFNRVKALLANFVGLPFVARVEAERFDHEQPGILKFDCVLVADPVRPL